MSQNFKTAARNVKTICSAMPKNAFNTLKKKNASADRNIQWEAVEHQFKTDCDIAQRILMTSDPQRSLLDQMNPEYTADIYERVLGNIGQTVPCLPLKSFNMPCRAKLKTRKGRKNRKTRRNRST
jgi:hypothetical protein